MDDDNDDSITQYDLYLISLSTCRCNPEPADTRKGPSRVSNKTYRDNYDAIFGPPKSKEYVN